MTAAELIAELRRLPPGAEVWLTIENIATVVDRVSLDTQPGVIDIIGEDV